MIGNPLKPVGKSFNGGSVETVGSDLEKLQHRHVKGREGKFTAKQTTKSRRLALLYGPGKVRHVGVHAAARLELPASSQA